MGQAFGACKCDNDGGTDAALIFRRSFGIQKSALKSAYDAGRELGRGLTGVVKEGVLPGFGKIAIKRIGKRDNTIGSVCDTASALRHEVSLLRRLQTKLAGHRHICHLRSFYEDAKFLYLVSAMPTYTSAPPFLHPTKRPPPTNMYVL